MLQKLKGRIGFGNALHILYVESCQWEAGAIKKFKSRKLTSKWKDRCY